MRCPQCRTENPPQAKFCLECATPFLRAASLEGERKQVSVLFADLKGSMEMLAGLDPEEARKLLDPVLERMMEAVHRYQGTVNQVLGDGIMALFGAPVAHEDHAVRACFAALRMQESVKRHAEEVHRSGGARIQIRVGVNSGEALVRTIGNDLHMDYSAVGQTTHIAARMEQMARPGSILVTAETSRLTEGYVEVKPLGPMPVKGIDDPIEVLELVGTGSARSRLHVSAARGLTKFVGRDTEVDVLGGALERARSGHGQVVGIVGEPGVGKSRLGWEFTHSQRARGWRVLESASIMYGKATPSLPLKAYFQIDAGDDAPAIREKVLAKLASLDPQLAYALPGLLSFLDVPVEDEQWEQLDPAQRRQRTVEAVKQVLLRETRVQPLLLWFEDLHLIDTETQALLDSLVESLPAAPLLLLVSYRPEYQHAWRDKPCFRQLRIGPLPRDTAVELLHTLLGDDPGLRPLKQSLIERTEGNPLFLEESVRTLIETDVLAGERGGFRVAKQHDSLQVPPTVQAVLAARIDRLPGAEKRLLQAAAVIGKHVAFELLKSIAEQPDEELRRGLAALQAADFLYEESLFAGLEYTFKHALTHQVAYEGLLQERRRFLHARIADAIERTYADHLPRIEQLAHHAMRGETWEKALVFSRQAGAKAYSRSANREAVAAFEQGLSALAHLPRSRANTERAIDLHLFLGGAFWSLGEVRQMLDHARAAESLAEELADQRQLGMASGLLSWCFWLVGEQVPALASGERTLGIATASAALPLQVRTSIAVAAAHQELGDYPRAIEILRRTSDVLTGSLAYKRLGIPGLASTNLCSFLAQAYAELGRFPEAIAAGEEGIEVAERADIPFARAYVYVGAGYALLRKGELHAAKAILQRGLELCRTAEIAVVFPVSAGVLGYAHAMSGNAAQGIPLLEQAIQQSGTNGALVWHSRLLVWLGEANLAARRMDQAAVLAQRALAFSRQHKASGWEAWALRLLGEIAAQEHPPNARAAATCFGEAIALAGQLGMRPLVGHCHLGLARLHAGTNAGQEARKHLADATALFRKMEMRSWLEQAKTIT